MRIYWGLVVVLVGLGGVVYGQAAPAAALSTVVGGEGLYGCGDAGAEDGEWWGEPRCFAWGAAYGGGGGGA